MTDDLNLELEPEHRPVPPQRRRGSSGIVIAVILFVFVASGAAYLGLNYADQVRSVAFAESPVSVPVVARGEDVVSRADFEAFKQQTTDSLLSAIARLDAQKDDLKRLSDQLAALVLRMDASQSAPARAPPVSLTQAGAIPSSPVVPRRPVALTQRKQSPAPKPSGPISLGGAPLPEAPD
ncbi:hypothetical protein [Afipia sp. GAS231]|uniref:hypothetical protein n=1 Tax=Afipia sp. GAS231 TaxID=1882747 RepID=UPI0012FB19BC|nr:hypothetical protein [Afipia sp. GAS231]